MLGNKSDLLDPSEKKPEVDIAVSAKNGDNITALLSRSLELIGAQHAVSTYSARTRHLHALEQFQCHITAALNIPQSQTDLVAEELRCAQQSLSEITGAFHSDDLLDAIFRAFCLGK